MKIFSVIKLDGKDYFLTDEQAKYVLKESVYAGYTSKFLPYINPYYDIDGNKFTTFRQEGEEGNYTYVEDPDGLFLIDEEGQYYNPLDNETLYSRDRMFTESDVGDYIYDSTSGTFVNPYEVNKRYIKEGEFTFEESDEGMYLYDPLLEANHGFYLPYMDKEDYTIQFDRYMKITDIDGTVTYIKKDNGEYIYDEAKKEYYNPLYDRDDQSIPLQRYIIDTNTVFTENENGAYIYKEGIGYYQPYENVQRYVPSDELSTYFEDAKGEFIVNKPFDPMDRPSFGFYSEFPEFDMENEVFVLGQEDIFKQDDDPSAPKYIEGRLIDDAELELGSIDRVNGQSLKDETKMRCSNYIELSGGQRYAITNDQDYWMQIFEYKWDVVLDDFIFVRSYKVTYGSIFKLHNLTTHVRVASGEGNTTDLSHVRIRLVTDDDASNYVFTGPVFETYDEAYKAGHYYFFDCSDRSMFCKLVGDGTDCQAYERYQISTKILKNVWEINDATNKAMSRIQQTGAEISMLVQATDKNLRSYILQQMSQIRLEVIEGEDNLHTQIQLTSDAITSMAMSDFIILGSRPLNGARIQYSVDNPENFAFSDVFPVLNENGEYVLNADRSIKTDFLTAYEKHYVYFDPGYVYIPDEAGLFILNGKYYDPYAKAIEDGKHRYKKVVDSEGNETFEVDDANGVYILDGSDYIMPYEKYPRYERFMAFCKLTYNMTDGYGYDIYTNATYRLYSIIEQTATQIRMEVSNESGMLLSRIVQTAESITMDVINLEKNTATQFKQTADEIRAVAMSGGYEIVESSSDYLTGVTDFYEARPILDGDDFRFNDTTKKTYEDHIAAYTDNHTFFPNIEGVFIESANGDYIEDEFGLKVNPYQGQQRYTQSEDIAAENPENRITYAQNENGRYIRKTDESGNTIFYDPYVGKTRYIKEPSYCQVAKLDEDSYTVNILISSSHKNQSEFKMTDREIKMGVTDVSGVMSSLVQTANSIKSQVQDANGTQMSTIEQNADRIAFNTESSIFKITTLNTIPNNIESNVNVWYTVPPKYVDGELQYNGSRAKQFNSHVNAYNQNYIYCSAGIVPVPEDNGRYVYLNGDYVNPYDGSQRYTKYIESYHGVEYIEDNENGNYYNVNGTYVLSEGVESGNSAQQRYTKVYGVLNREVYKEDPNGNFIKTIDGLTYYDPYVGQTRYELYPSYYVLGKDDVSGEYYLEVYAFLESKNSNLFEQTAEMTRSTVSSENSERMSQLSQTEKEIMAQVINNESLNSSKFAITDDRIEAAVQSGSSFIISSHNSSDFPSNITEFYNVVPTYDSVGKYFKFRDTDYITKHKYPTSNPVSAYESGYVFSPNPDTVYAEDSTGDYIFDGTYHIPYDGQTRYSRTGYDSNSTVHGGYIYEEDPTGKYIRRGEDYYDPYEGQTRYIRLESAPEYTTYTKIVDIVRTRMSYSVIAENENDDLLILPGSTVIVNLGGTIYSFSPANAIYNGFGIRFDIATAEICYYTESTVYETFQPGEYEEVTDYPDEAEGTFIFREYSTNYSDIFFWHVMTSLPKRLSSSIEQSSKEIKMTVSTLEGAQSQIKQTAHSIDSMVKGAPECVEEITDPTQVANILSFISTFYNNIPAYTKNGVSGNPEFSFDGIPSIDETWEVARDKNYHYFAAEAGRMVQDNNGEYIRIVTELEPTRIYYNPKENPENGIPYQRLPGATEEYDVYLPDESGDVNNTSSLYFMSADGTYYSPWLTDPNGRYDENGMPDPDGMYLVNIIPNYDIAVKRPYYNDDDFTKRPRFSKIIVNDENGNLIGKYDEEFDTYEYYDPYEGQQRFSRVFIAYPGEPSGNKLVDYIYDLETGDYYLPYYNKHDQSQPIPRFSPIIENNYDGLPTRFEEDENGDYCINEDGSYYLPYEGQTIYYRDYVPYANGNYIFDSDYFDPMEGVQHFRIKYTPAEDGRYILRDDTDDFYDPYLDENGNEITSDQKYSKYPTYGKVIIEDGNDIIRYYSTINLSVATNISQTAEEIRLSADDDNADLHTHLSIRAEQIKSEVENRAENVNSQIQQTANQIRMEIADKNNKTNANIRLNADGIDSAVVGSFVLYKENLQEVILMGDPAKSLYNLVPRYDNGLFFNRGYKKDVTVNNADVAISDGYKYDTCYGFSEAPAGSGKHILTYLQAGGSEYTFIDPSRRYRQYATIIQVDPDNDKIINNSDIYDGSFEFKQEKPVEYQKVISYIQDDIGEYIIDDSDPGNITYYKPTAWYREYNGYKRYNNASISGTSATLTYDIFVKADTEYNTLIEMTANQIKQQITNADEDLSSKIVQSIGQIGLRVDDLRSNVYSTLSVAVDQISAVAAGAYIKVSSNSTTDIVEGYNEVPEHDGSAFGNSGVSRSPLSQSDIDAGFIYCVSPYGECSVPCKEDEADAFKAGSVISSKSSLNSSDRYTLNVIADSYDGTSSTRPSNVTTNYIQSSTGEYYRSGNNYYPITWLKAVSSYRKYTSVVGGVASYDLFIKSTDDYASRISQTSNEINLSVTNLNKELSAEIQLLDNQISFKIDDLNQDLTAKIVLNQDQIQSLVHGSFVKVDSGSESASGLVVYRHIPEWNESVFVDNTEQGAILSQNNIDDGFIYRVSTSSYYVACMESDASHYSYNNGNPISGPPSTSSRYTISKSPNSSNTSITTNYIQSSTGEYYRSGNNYYPITWFKAVSSYRKYTSVVGGVASYDLFIKSTDDYASRISQTSNEINLSVTNLNKEADTYFTMSRNLIATKVSSIAGDESFGWSMYPTGVIFHCTIDDVNTNVLTISSTGLSVSGIVNAWSGTIGIWTLDKTTGLYAKIGNYYAGIGCRIGDPYNRPSLKENADNSPVRFFCGAVDTNPYPDRGPDDCAFAVLEDGSLYASYAQIAGHITARSGYIGAWYISDISIANPSGLKNGLMHTSSGLRWGGSSVVFFAGLQGIDDTLTSSAVSNIMDLGESSSSSIGSSFLVTESGDIAGNRLYAMTMSGVTASFGILTSDGIACGELLSTYARIESILAQSLSLDNITVNRIISASDNNIWIDMYYNPGATIITYSYSANVWVQNPQGLLSATIHVSISGDNNGKLIESKTFVISYENVFGGNKGTTSVTISNGSSSGSVTVDKFWAIDKVSITPSSFTQSRTESSNSGGIDVHGNLTPYYSSYKLGSASYRWDTLYVSNIRLYGSMYQGDAASPMSLSDSRMKHDITYLNDESVYYKMYDDIKVVSYRYNNRTRLHFGMMADDILDTLNTYNIATNDFAAYCEVDVQFSDTESEIYKALRYTEFIPLNILQIQKHTQRIQKIEDKIKDLQRQLNELKGTPNNSDSIIETL